LACFCIPGNNNRALFLALQLWLEAGLRAIFFKLEVGFIDCFQGQDRPGNNSLEIKRSCPFGFPFKPVKAAFDLEQPGIAQGGK